MGFFNNILTFKSLSNSNHRTLNYIVSYCKSNFSIEIAHFLWTPMIQLIKKGCQEIALLYNSIYCL